MRGLALLLGAALLSGAIPAWGTLPDGGRSPADRRIAQKGRWFVDPAGRVITLHGGNISLPPLDGAAGPDARWTPDTPTRMAEQGFTAVRLVIFFRDVMPQPGRIDQSYLDRIARAVAALKAEGIYTLIDFHQDEYAALVGVRGMPDWAVFTDGHAKMPGVEFPIGYFKDPAVQHAFDNFWNNHPVPPSGKGVQDFYADGLAAVARRFRDEPAVLGIDIFNEPATGSRCATPDPVSANCPALEQQLLRPFYAKAAAAINRAAPRMIVFFEPFMLQGALGMPIHTPLAGPSGRRALSFHNYGPVKDVRDRVNDSALAHVIASDAAIINTEWGFTNNPADIAGQAADFDARHISWLAWARGPFEGLADPRVRSGGNGNRLAVLRAYARPYASATAGTPVDMRFDPDAGRMQYRFRVIARGPARGVAAETEIRIPAIQYPQGYTVTATGADVISAPNAPVLRLRNKAAAREVSVSLARVGDLPPLPQAPATADMDRAPPLPPIPAGPLTRQSLLGHIVATPGGRDVMERQLPGVFKGLSHLHGWQAMTLGSLQQFAPGEFTEARLAAIEADLKPLKVTPGPVPSPAAAPPPGRLGIDSLTGDLLADSRARAILERDAPGLATSRKQGLFPQTRLRNLQPELPDILTDAVLARIAADLQALN